jgi:cold shock protein
MPNGASVGMHRLPRLSLKALRLRHEAPYHWTRSWCEMDQTLTGCPSVFGVIVWSCEQLIPSEQIMPKGTVKWFSSQKGYGFIQPQGGGKDVFVHISAVERAGLSGLNEGQVVEYEEVSDRGKTSAGNLRVQR